MGGKFRLFVIEPEHMWTQNDEHAGGNGLR
ncbi:hypothetical protein SAMN05444167_1122 [Terriglobus roseus]|uniref:Uncharacterized protein n=1 Tax=Terriglobus roseus TaxID=392734 RepID=A0A1G7HLC4_9BACT|nr:hypothetical protein SAMN05444167_1122 [Terriglobus roseus]